LPNELLLLTGGFLERTKDLNSFARPSK